MRMHASSQASAKVLSKMAISRPTVTLILEKSFVRCFNISLNYINISIYYLACIFIAEAAPIEHLTSYDHVGCLHGDHKPDYTWDDYLLTHTRCADMCLHLEMPYHSINLKVIHI